MILKQCDVINCHWTHATRRRPRGGMISYTIGHYSCMVHAGVDLQKLSRGGQKKWNVADFGGGG